MHILVVRHPETEANIRKLIYSRTESAYTERGLSSMGWMLQKLKDKRIDAIYTSPMQRTIKLADEISAQQGCPVILSNALHEMDFGLFENMTQFEVKEKHRDHFNSYMADYSNYKIPEGESFQDVYTRLSSFIKPLLVKEGTIILVTHGMVMKAAIAYLLGIELNAVWHFNTKPATILEIDYRENYGVLVELTGPDAN